MIIFHGDLEIKSRKNFSEIYHRYAIFINWWTKQLWLFSYFCLRKIVTEPSNILIEPLLLMCLRYYANYYLYKTVLRTENVTSVNALERIHTWLIHNPIPSNPLYSPPKFHNGSWIWDLGLNIQDPTTQNSAEVKKIKKSRTRNKIVDQSTVFTMRVKKNIFSVKMQKFQELAVWWQCPYITTAYVWSFFSFDQWNESTTTSELDVILLLKLY